MASAVRLPPATRERGSSLVELVVSLALGVLMLTMMAGSVLALALGEQNNAAAAGLVSSIEAARAEAALRHIPVGVCGVDARDTDRPADSLRCTDGVWTGGWVTFVDGNANQTLDDGESVLQVQRTRRVHVQAAQAMLSHAIGFRPTGTLAHPVPVRLTVNAAQASDPNARAVCVGIDGFVQVISVQATCR